MSSKTGNTWRDEVLDQLDEASEESALLGPANVNYPSAALRMDAFSSSDEWILVIQLLAWGRQDVEFVNLVQAFGNHVDEPGSLEFLTPVRPPAGQRLWDDMGKFRADLFEYSVLLGDNERNFSLSEQDYRDAGIDTDETEPALSFIRMLSHRERDELIAPPARILEILNKETLSHLFGIDEWQAPDPAEDELPQNIPCFRDIASAIEEGATEPPVSCSNNANTHWKNWTWLTD